MTTAYAHFAGYLGVLGVGVLVVGFLACLYFANRSVNRKYDR